ncbi:hypothetical protein BKA62DRAFT_774937 [Auriculariales sp. MPI-PUGE-AT-0066]|nr:hypothetical protein BKA62DRAFT_774937 [Auriculariales sp. MPI-PUGE-AT-0066]
MTTGVIRTQQHNGTKIITYDCFVKLPPECFKANPTLTANDIHEYKTEFSKLINQRLVDELKGHGATDWKPQGTGVRLNELMPYLVKKKLCLVNYPHALPMPYDPFPTGPNTKNKGGPSQMKGHEQDLLYTWFHVLSLVRIVDAIYITPDQRRRLRPPRDEEIIRYGANKFNQRPEFFIIVTDVIHHTCGGSFRIDIRPLNLCPTVRNDQKRKRQADDGDGDGGEEDERPAKKGKTEPAGDSLGSHAAKKLKRSSIAITPVDPAVKAEATAKAKRIARQLKEVDRLRDARLALVASQHARQPSPPRPGFIDVDTSEASEGSDDDDRPLVLAPRAALPSASSRSGKADEHKSAHAKDVDTQDSEDGDEPEPDAMDADEPDADADADADAMDVHERGTQRGIVPDATDESELEQDAEADTTDKHDLEQGPEPYDMDKEQDVGPDDADEEQEDMDEHEPEQDVDEEHDTMDEHEPEQDVDEEHDAMDKHEPEQDVDEEQDEHEPEQDEHKEQDEHEPEQGVEEEEQDEHESEQDGEEEQDVLDEHEPEKDAEQDAMNIDSTSEPDATHKHDEQHGSPDWDMSQGSDDEVERAIAADAQPPSESSEPPQPPLLYLPIELDDEFQEPGKFYALWHGFPYDINRAKKCIQAAISNLRKTHPVCALTTAEQLVQWKRAWPSEDDNYEQPPVAMNILFSFAEATLRNEGKLGLDGDSRPAHTPTSPSASPAKATRGAKARKRTVEAHETDAAQSDPPAKPPKKGKGGSKQSTLRFTATEAKSRR